MSTLDGQEKQNTWFSLLDASFSIHQSYPVFPPLSVVEETSSLHTINKNKSNTSPGVPAFKGNLVRICNNDKLLSKLKHWMTSKVKLKVMPTENSLATFLLGFSEIEQARMSSTTTTTTTKIGSPPYIPPMNASIVLPLAVTNGKNKYLWEGIVVRSKTSSLSSSADPHIHMSPVALYQCASRLYSQMYGWRVSLGRRVSLVPGFCISYDDHEISISFVYLIHMQNNSTGSTTTESHDDNDDENVNNLIGQKMKGAEDAMTHGSLLQQNPWQLQVFTYRAPLAQGDKLLQHLANTIINFKDISRLQPPLTISMECIRCPGPAMLLTDQILSTICNNPSRFQIMSTMSGSLVIRCIGLTAVQILLGVASIPFATDRESDAVWYVKVKTPMLLGPFWNTASIAINSTRSRLKHQLAKGSSGYSLSEVTVARRWLRQHPYDALIQSHSHILILPDQGIPFRGQLKWNDFCRAFDDLIQSTIQLQRISLLVHGDIHEGNVLFDTISDLTTTKNFSGNCNGIFCIIDWDEALREKPCIRETQTEAQQKQYPGLLVDHPIAYTKHQLMVLFDTWLVQYYDKKQQEQWEEYQRAVNSELKVVKRTHQRMQQLIDFLRSVNDT